jgi:hypothetical protein
MIVDPCGMAFLHGGFGGFRQTVVPYYLPLYDGWEAAEPFAPLPHGDLRQLFPGGSSNSAVVISSAPWRVDVTP